MSPSRGSDDGSEEILEGAMLGNMLMSSWKGQKTFSIYGEPARSTEISHALKTKTVLVSAATCGKHSNVDVLSFSKTLATIQNHEGKVHANSPMANKQVRQ